MSGFDKIRVLVIDDCPMKSPLQEEYDKWFQIVPHGYDAIENREEFFEFFEKFDDDNDISCFPVEIIAMDYHLDINESRVGFSGLVIAAFYAAITRNHPLALVPITCFTSGDGGLSVEDMPATAHQTQDIIRDYLGFADENLREKGGKAKEWDSIFKHGMPVLRDQIKRVYESGKTILSLDDLIELTDENTEHKTLTIESPWITKVLPIEALFIDIEEKERAKKRAEWVKGLLQLHITESILNDAIDSANKIWEGYLDAEKMKKHFALSQAIAKLNKYKKTMQDEAIEEEFDKIKKEYKDFEIKETEQGKTNIVAICEKEYCEIQDISEKDMGRRRWAALFLMMKFLDKVVSYEQDNLRHPPIDENDILLLFYPRSKNLPCPWAITQDSKYYNNKKNSLKKWVLENLKIDIEKLLNPDLAQGNSDKHEGLKKGEKVILESALLSSTKLSSKIFGEENKCRRDNWEDCKTTKYFLFYPPHTEDKTENAQ